MGQLLAATLGVDERFRGGFGKARLGDFVGRCESDQQDISYGCLHHYAKHARISTASLYVVARFASLLRDAANCTGPDREVILADGRVRIQAMLELLNGIRVIIEDFEEGGFADGLQGPKVTSDVELADRRYALINLLIERCRGDDLDDELLQPFSDFRDWDFEALK